MSEPADPGAAPSAAPPPERRKLDPHLTLAIVFCVMLWTVVIAAVCRADDDLLKTLAIGLLGLVNMAGGFYFAAKALQKKGPAQ